MGDSSESLNAIVITVCIGTNIADEFVRALENRSWSVSLSNFDSYLSASRRPSFGSVLKRSSVCVAFVDFDQDPLKAIETAQYLTLTFGAEIKVIALAKNKDSGTILTAMRSGCSEFLHKPISGDALSEILDRLEKAWSASMKLTTQSGSIFSFFGAKGGVGTTTLAVHLAVYLVQCQKKRVLLIDHHPKLGHVCIYLGLDGSRYHFYEVVRNVSRLDSELLRGFVVRHSSGLDVLSSPDVCGDLKLMNKDSIARTLDFLRSEYDYLILDCAMSLEEENVPIIGKSTGIYLVATPEVGAVRDLSRYIDKFSLFEDVAEKIQVVINRSSSLSGIDSDQIEKAIRLPIAFNIPNSYPELVRSENMGQPIAPKSKSELASSFERWTNTIVGLPKNYFAGSSVSRLFSIWK